MESFATYSLCESEDRFPTYSLANGLPFTSTTKISVPNCIPRACHDLYASVFACAVTSAWKVFISFTSLGKLFLSESPEVASLF